MRARNVFPLIAIAIVVAFSLLVHQSSAADPLDPQQGASEQGASSGSDGNPPEVKTGVISSTGGYRGAVKIDQASTGEATGDTPNVITGSVASSGKNQCVARVTNSSPEFKYSVSFKVIGTNQRGMKVLSRNFSATLNPQETASRTVNNCGRDLNLALKVLSGRPIASKSSKKKDS
jgi:hypothetical protein